MLKFDGRRSLNNTFSVEHTQTFVCFVKSKTERFFASFITIPPVFKTTKLMDFCIKACGNSMVDLNWTLSSNITIFTSAFNLQSICNDALSHFSHQATILFIPTGALQTGHRYVCISVLRSMKQPLPLQFFHKRKRCYSLVTKIATSSFFETLVVSVDFKIR